MTTDAQMHQARLHALRAAASCTRHIAHRLRQQPEIETNNEVAGLAYYLEAAASVTDPDTDNLMRDELVRQLVHETPFEVNWPDLLDTGD